MAIGIRHVFKNIENSMQRYDVGESGQKSTALLAKNPSSPIDSMLDVTLPKVKSSVQKLSEDRA